MAFGEPLDFWRVTDLEGGRRLSLRAEMKLPGEALLELAVEPLSDRSARLVQTARFLPKGLLSLAYWYEVLPVHAFVFRGMLHGTRRAALALAGGGASA